MRLGWTGEKLHQSEPAYLLTDGDAISWNDVLSFGARLIIYIAVLVLVMAVVLAIMKCLGQLEAAMEEPREGESRPLQPSKKAAGYGACAAECSGKPAENCSGGWSEDLYEGRLCAICYDDERNCFFVPCGHCATCYSCAQRIYKVENKTCPVCRRLIRKVRKWFAP